MLPVSIHAGGTTAGVAVGVGATEGIADWIADPVDATDADGAGVGGGGLAADVQAATRITAIIDGATGTSRERIGSPSDSAGYGSMIVVV